MRNTKCFRANDGSMWAFEHEAEARDHLSIRVPRKELAWLRDSVLDEMDDSTQRDIAVALLDGWLTATPRYPTTGEEVSPHHEDDDFAPPIPRRQNVSDALKFNDLREWRMSNANLADYPTFDSSHEGFAGVIGVITDRWCRECEHRIDQEHSPRCSVGKGEAANRPDKANSADSPPPAPEEAVRLVDGMMRAYSDWNDGSVETYEAFEEARTDLLNFITAEHQKLVDSKAALSRLSERIADMQARFRAKQSELELLTAEKEAMQKVVDDAKQCSEDASWCLDFPTCLVATENMHNLNNSLEALDALTPKPPTDSTACDGRPMEYDGAFNCGKCGATWGAITSPDPKTHATATDSTEAPR